MKSEYHKIQTVYLRDPDTKHRFLLDGKFAKEEFRFLKDAEWSFTEKVDGTNIRVIRENGSPIRFGGKTDNAQIPPKLSEKLAELFLTVTARQQFEKTFPNGDICLYGEGFGGNIQKAGRLYGDSPDFVLFDVRVGNFLLMREDVVDVAYHLNLQVVPEVGIGSLTDMIKLVRDGFLSTWGEFYAEGLVARPIVELFNRKGERIITKLKYKDFPR